MVFCGKGNNGGDGFVAARKLHEQGKKVQVILLADPGDLRGDAAVMFGKLPPDAAITVHSSEELNSERIRQALQADLYIDAILGTGFKPPVSGLYADAIAILNAGKVRIVAVDIPSGADADVIGPQPGTMARADAVVTFTAPRPAHLFSPLTDGPTVVAQIGSPREAISSALQLNVITAPDLAEFIRPRAEDSNKGNYGHVLLVGGSLGKAGAAAMAGMAVLRAGGGLSTVATAKSALAPIASFHPELMTEPLPESDAGTISRSAEDRIRELAKGKDVARDRAGDFARLPNRGIWCGLWWRNLPVAHGLDADGLNAFEGHADELNGKNKMLVITPHPGEMARLAGCSVAEVQNDRLGMARNLPANTN